MGKSGKALGTGDDIEATDGPIGVGGEDADSGIYIPTPEEVRAVATEGDEKNPRIMAIAEKIVEGLKGADGRQSVSVVVPGNVYEFARATLSHQFKQRGWTLSFRPGGIGQNRKTIVVIMPSR